MRIDKIKEIVNSEWLNQDQMDDLVLFEIANDEKAIPKIMKMLDEERRNRRELVQDLNLHLSKAHIALTSPKLNKDGFVQDEIIQFFIKHKETKNVGHCFMNTKDLQPSNKQ